MIDGSMAQLKTNMPRIRFANGPLTGGLLDIDAREAVLLLGAMVLVPLMTHQLQGVGKQRPQEAASMLVVFGVAYVAAMVWQVLKYRKLGPEGARLRGLVASYRE